MLNFINRAPIRAFRVLGFIPNFSKIIVLIINYSNQVKTFSRCPEAYIITITNHTKYSNIQQYLFKSPPQRSVDPERMDTTKLVKGYETKILQLSSELQQVRTEKQQMVIEQERVRRLLADSNQELQGQRKEVEDKERQCQRLRKEKEELEKIGRKSQRHRKILYDHLFTETDYRGAVQESGHRNELMAELNTLNDQFCQSNLTQMQTLIQERNNEVTKLSKKYSELMKTHLQSINEYQEKIIRLKEENGIFRRSQQARIEVQKEIEKTRPRNYEELRLTNKSLEERIALLVERVQVDEDTIRNLTNQLEHKRYYNEQQSPKTTFQSLQAPQVQQYLSMVKENKALKESIEQCNQKYQKLVVEFPNLIDSEDQIIDLLEKYKSIHKLEADVETKNIRIAGLEGELDRARKDSTRYMKQLESKRAEYIVGEQYYQNVIEKLKEFFIMVNPHYDVYQFQQIGLSPEEETAFKKQRLATNQVTLNTEIHALKDKVIKLTGSLEAKLAENLKMQQLLQRQNKKILQLKTINDKLHESIKQKSVNILTQNDSRYLSNISQMFSKLQEQRNCLKTELRDKEIRIINLMVENSSLREKADLESKERQWENQTIVSEIAICRPEIVCVEFNRELPAIQAKLLELEERIKEQHHGQELIIGQLKASHSKQISCLKQKILKLESQNKTLSSHCNILPHHASQPQSQDPAHLQQLQSMNDTMLELDDQIGHRDSLDEPVNTLSSQSVEEMSRLLKMHEANMKNIMDAYTQLKGKYDKLQHFQKQQSEDQQVKELKGRIDQYASQIQAMKARLNQSDTNLLALQHELKVKASQIVSIKQTYRQQTETLNKCIANLKKQLQTGSQQNWLESPINYKTSKQYFPEEIEYLLQVIMDMKQKIKQSITKEKESEKKGSQMVPEGKDSQQWQQQQYKQLTNLIKQGNLVSVLEQAINTIKEQQQQLEEQEQRQYNSQQNIQQQ